MGKSSLQVLLGNGHHLMGFDGELGGAETTLRGPWDGMESVLLILCLPSLHPERTETALLELLGDRPTEQPSGPPSPHGTGRCPCLKLFR